MFFGTGAPGALTRLFENADLGHIQERRQSEILVFRSDEDVVDAVLHGGPVALAVKRFAEDVWAEVQQEFLASVVDYRLDDGSYRIPGEFVTVRGDRAPN